MSSLQAAFLAALSIAVLAAASAGGSVQEASPARPREAQDNYSGTDGEGSYQKALDAAIAKANEAFSHAGGAQVSDAMFSWQVVAVTGTRGGIMGKREVTVTIHAKP